MRVQLVACYIQEEAICLCDSRLDQALGCIACTKPCAVCAIKVYAGARVFLEPVNRVVQHREAVSRGGRGIRLRGLAHLVVRIRDPRVAVSEWVIPGDDAKTVGLQDYNGLAVADAGCEAVDPGLIFCLAGGAARAELSAVAEWDVVRDEDRNHALVCGTLHSVSNILL